MGLFVPLERGIQVECVYKLDNRILSNRLWFVVVDNDPTTADLTAVGEGVKDWCIENVVPLLSSDLDSKLRGLMMRLCHIRAHRCLRFSTLTEE